MKHLVVPIQIDCLRLNKGKTVMNEMANFSKQPWSDGQHDYNTEHPYIGETVLSEAFQNDTLYLEAGNHLFWQIPRALRVANSVNQSFPCVPNRWLINRLGKDNLPKKQWIIESDFLSNLSDAGINKNPINIAVPNQAKNQPYKYMGRQISWENWKTPPSSRFVGLYWKDYFNKGLTALGYGEPSFSTFFPNCRSVFGCWDEKILNEPHTYEILGWYAETQDDIFHEQQTLEEQKNQAQKFNWLTDWQAIKEPLHGTLFYGRISTHEHQPIASPTINSVSVGNSGSEALSAYIAQKIETEQGGNKDNIEDTLEAILFGSKIKNGSIDSVPNFHEARHQKGFDGQEGGLLWTLRETAKDPRQGSTLTSVSLPYGTAEKLNALNLAQQAYDKATEKLELLNFQLYSDWCKYIQTCYPPLGEGQNFPNMDDIKAFIQNELDNKIIPLQQHTGKLVVNHDTEKDTFSVLYASGFNADNAAKKVVDLFNELKNNLPTTWEINKTASSRYYTPKDPVVMFAGDVKDFDYLNSDILPQLKLALSDFNSITIKSNSAVNKVSIKKLIGIENTQIDFNVKPITWQPQLLQWLTEYYPVKQGSNQGSETNTFNKDYISRNFTLPENAFDFDKQPELMEDGLQYAGSTYLSGSVKAGYMARLEAFIEKSPDGKPKEIAVSALNLLKTKFIISQSIGGFHQALLQHRHNIHLPIEDPLGFKAYKEFTTKIAQQLQGKNHLMAPLPAEAFMPIRVGGIQFRQLKFTNQFGEESFAPIQNIISSRVMNMGPDINKQWLSPRLSQPVRLQMRWLSAKNHAIEVNSHKNTSPVCGWVVANYLNSQLAFYKSDGTQLGYFATSGKWYPALGSNNAFIERDINPDNPDHINRQLLQILLFLKNRIGTINPSRSNDFLQCFINALETAQGNIYPASTALHDATALLMSKPMAIVQTQIGFEPKGGLRYDQGWDALTANMKPPYTRTKDGYENVQFPIRLGEQKQLDDGLVGYWVNHTNGSFVNDTFFANTIGDNHQGITHNNLIQKSLQEAPNYLTMLMDPRAILHATTGILPVKTIQIPAQHYTQALKKIEVDFLTAPIVSAESDVSITTPLEKNKAWQWIKKTGNDQTEEEKITSFDENGTFTKQKIKEGWLKLKNS